MNERTNKTIRRFSKLKSYGAGLNYDEVIRRYGRHFKSSPNEQISIIKTIAFGEGSAAACMYLKEFRRRSPKNDFIEFYSCKDPIFFGAIADNPWALVPEISSEKSSDIILILIASGWSPEQAPPDVFRVIRRKKWYKQSAAAILAGVPWKNRVLASAIRDHYSLDAVAKISMYQFMLIGTHSIDWVSRYLRYLKGYRLKTESVLKTFSSLLATAKATTREA